MKTTIELLQQLNLEELIELDSFYKRPDTNPEYEVGLKEQYKIQQIETNVSALLKQLHTDFEALPTKGFDAGQAAKALMEELYKVARDNGNLKFTPDKLEKIVLLNDLISTEMQQGPTGHRLNELWQGVNTLNMQSLEEVRDRIIKDNVTEHINTTIKAIKSKDLHATAQALIDLGTFSQDYFPTAEVEQQKEIIMALQLTFKELPDDLIALKAIVATKEEDNSLYKLDALDKGCALFGELMGNENIKAKVPTTPLDPTVIKKAQHAVNKASYQDSEARAQQRAEAIISDIMVRGRTCIKHLEEVLLKELKKLPEEIQAQYRNEDGQGYAFQRLADDVAQATNAFNQWKTNISKDIHLAAKSYKAIMKVTEALNIEGDASLKLREFKQAFEDREVNKSLKTNPDSKVKAYFKAIGYILANVLTLGIVYAVARGAPLQSPQQQFKNAIQETLKAAEEKDLIRPPSLK